MAKHQLVIAMGYVEDHWYSSRIFAENLAAGLADLGDFETHLYAPSCGHPPRWTDRRFRYARSLPRADVFHLIDHSYGDALIEAKRRSHRTLVTVHDLAFWYKANLLNAPLRRRIARGIGAADLRVCISAETASRYEQGFGPATTAVINPGAACDVFTHWPGARQQRLLVNVGSSIWRKGLDRLLRLLAMLPPEYRLLQLGAAWTREQDALIDQLGLRGRIEHRVEAAQAEVRDAYRRAELVMVPSRYEGFSVPVVEARLTGTPVVASVDIPAATALKGDRGILQFDFAAFDDGGDDECRSVAVSKLLGYVPGIVALLNREAHDWRTVAKRYAEHYRNLLAGG